MNEKANVTKELNAKHRKVFFVPIHDFSFEFQFIVVDLVRFDDVWLVFEFG